MCERGEACVGLAGGGRGGRCSPGRSGAGGAGPRVSRNPTRSRARPPPRSRHPPSGPPPPAGPPLSSPRTRSAPGGPLPGDGGECARPWAELLRAGSADLSPDGELPPLPAFRGPVCAVGPRGGRVWSGARAWPGRRRAPLTRPNDPVWQEPGRVPERPASPEVFTVGARTFSWTPFPPAPRGGGGPGRSYRVLLGARGRSGSPSRSPQRRPGPEPLATPGVREQLREAAPTLRSCPMCAADFAPR